ncbi:MAG: hypothetical protein EPO02_07945 [Nitrospirae bacterium]|nr:MAG: hypothetical protein EPO02_07945 [Nitrospirota bacterium]
MMRVGAGRPFIALAAAVIVVSFLWGCSRDPTPQAPSPAGGGAPAAGGSGPTGNRPPVIRSAVIFPASITIETELRVESQIEDMDGDPVTSRYKWLVNGSPVPGETSPQFKTDGLKNGDRITVELTPNDGKVDGAAYVSNPVTVGNTAPDIAEIHLEPAPVRRGEPLKAKVIAGDPDGDPVTLSYKWLRNDKEIPDAKSDTLDTKDFRKKDVLAVLVTASDGKATREGRAGLPVTIVNSPPRFTSTPPSGITLAPAKDGPAREGMYEYAVTAMDPDEDPVTFELKQGPPGMTIDAATGKITWKVTLESAGKHHVVIAAKDNDGGVNQQDFDLDIPLAQPAAGQ